MQEKTLKRNVFQRILGIPATKKPIDNECWSYNDGKITIDLQRTTELSEKNGAIRLESKDLPKKVLVIQGDDGGFYAFHNKCSHAGRCLDPVPGDKTVQCCSVGKATFDYEGNVIKGSAKKNIQILPIKKEKEKLIINIAK
ncbi:MAG: Rieske 2Fe-2S domain-containing protein [Spirochaetota bacterium]|nr:Rieske 2Fe-2S domain-containing protein [Spirochaetota bacterium]